MNALNVLCAQLMRDLFAIAKFLFKISAVITEESYLFLVPVINL